MQQLGYLVDLSACRFSDEGSGWIQAMPLGKFTHPVYGEIDITPERVQRFAANVKSGVRGQDLDIDYDHKVKTTEAAGWVKDAEARANGLWIFVEWTKEAWGKIKSKAYRYFSPELVDEWKHPSTGMLHKDVLFGGGLTNRPFLKGILPINLSELSFGEATSVGGHMDPKLLRQLLGLPEDATDEAVTSKIGELTKPPASDGDGTKTPASDGEGTKTPQLVLAAEITKLAESSPAVKALTEQLTAQTAQIQQLQATMRLSEANSTVLKLTEPFESEGVSVAFGEPVKTALQEVLLLTEGDLREKIVKLFESFKSGIVPLGEAGSHKKTGGSDNPVKAFSDAVTKVQAERKVAYTDATIIVAAENPQLFEEYRQASFAGRE